MFEKYDISAFWIPIERNSRILQTQSTIASKFACFFWQNKSEKLRKFFHQIFGQATFVDKMKTLLTDTYGFGPSNLIMSRNCETLFIPPLHQFYRPYDLKNLYFLAFCGIGQHKSTFESISFGGTPFWNQLFFCKRCFLKNIHLFFHTKFWIFFIVKICFARVYIYFLVFLWFSIKFVIMNTSDSSHVIFRWYFFLLKWPRVMFHTAT